jgi:hypothetical protein
MMFLFRRKVSIVLLVLVVLAAAVVAVVAQDIRTPTYDYYGQVLSIDEFLKLVEAGTELHCVQLPSASVYLDDRAVSDYACFNTEEERDFYGDTLDAEWERIARENPAPQFPGPQNSGASAILSNHWALFANSGYNGWLADLHSPTSCWGSGTDIWSIWKDGSPPDITLYPNTNCTGSPSFAYNTQRWSFLPWPAECGGCNSGKVP